MVMVALDWGAEEWWGCLRSLIQMGPNFGQQEVGLGVAAGEVVGDW